MLLTPVTPYPFSLPFPSFPSSNVTAGRIAFDHSSSLPLTRAVALPGGAGQPQNSACPPPSPPGKNTLCDCSSPPPAITTMVVASRNVANGGVSDNGSASWMSAPVRTDSIVAMSATSIDENFNSFHCFTSGVNVCAFGTNTNSKGNGGSCLFVLPAGAT